MAKLSVDLEELRHRPLFIGLRDSQLRALARTAVPRVFSAGELIFSAAQIDDRVLVLQRGLAVMRDPADESRYCASFRPGSSFDPDCDGDVLGEFNLIDLTPWPAAVIAVERCVALELQRERLFDLFTEDSDLKVGMILNITRILSRRLRLARNKPNQGCK
jgi:CRP-like cAMP-binding protein